MEPHKPHTGFVETIWAPIHDLLKRLGPMAVAILLLVAGFRMPGCIASAMAVPLMLRLTIGQRLAYQLQVLLRQPLAAVLFKRDPDLIKTLKRRLIQGACFAGDAQYLPAEIDRAGLRHLAVLLPVRAHDYRQDCRRNLLFGRGRLASGFARYLLLSVAQ
jgi:hypothetical protein